MCSKPSATRPSWIWATRDRLAPPAAHAERVPRRAVALGLEVVDQHHQTLAAGRAEVVLRAVPREHHAVGVPVVDVGAQGGDGVPPAGEDADVDAAGVVAVEQQRLVVRRPADVAQQGRREHLQHRPGLGLDDAEHVGADVADHHGGVRRRQLGHRLRGELDEADPVGAAVRDDLGGAVAVPDQQPSPQHPEQRELTDVGADQAEHLELLEDLGLRRVVVRRSLEQLGDPGLRGDHRCRPGPDAAAQRLGAVEHVLHVVRRQPGARGLRTRWSRGRAVGEDAVHGTQHRRPALAVPHRPAEPSASPRRRTPTPCSPTGAFPRSTTT